MVFKTTTSQGQHTLNTTGQKLRYHVWPYGGSRVCIFDRKSGRSFYRDIGMTAGESMVNWLNWREAGYP